jgi:DNA-binding transcriptional MerR regulator
MATIHKHRRSQADVGLKSLARRVLEFRPDKTLYSMQEVINLTGLSREQIEYMCAKELIPQPRRKLSRTRRKLPQLFFPVRDVLKALIIADIRDAKFSLQKVRKLADNLEGLGEPLDENTYLLTDGKSIKVAVNDNRVIDVLRDNRQMYLLVCLKPKVTALRA